MVVQPEAQRESGVQYPQCHEGAGWPEVLDHPKLLSPQTPGDIVWIHGVLAPFCSHPCYPGNRDFGLDFAFTGEQHFPQWREEKRAEAIL